MAEQTEERTYSEAEITEHLARELPHWTFERGWIAGANTAPTAGRAR